MPTERPVDPLNFLCSLERAVLDKINQLRLAMGLPELDALPLGHPTAEFADSLNLAFAELPLVPGTPSRPIIQIYRGCLFVRSQELVEAMFVGWGKHPTSDMGAAWRFDLPMELQLFMQLYHRGDYAYLHPSEEDAPDGGAQPFSRIALAGI